MVPVFAKQRINQLADICSFLKCLNARRTGNIAMLMKRQNGGRGGAVTLRSHYCLVLFFIYCESKFTFYQIVLNEYTCVCYSTFFAHF